MDLHLTFSTHEKQFVYLPLAILDSATNIRQLFSHIENETKLNDLVRKIHAQMSSKRWASELSNLRFIDTTGDGGNAIEQDVKNSDEATATIPNARTTRSASLHQKVTAMENTSNVVPPTKKVAKEKPATSFQLRKRKVK